MADDGQQRHANYRWLKVAAGAAAVATMVTLIALPWQSVDSTLAAPPQQACPGGTPCPTDTPTSTPTETPTSTPTGCIVGVNAEFCPTDTPTSTATSTPTATATPTSTP